MMKQKEEDIVARLYMGHKFTGSVQVVSCDGLKDFFLQNSQIYIKWRLDVETADQCYFENVTSLTTEGETLCHGLYYNVCQLQAYHSTARLNNLAACLHDEVAVVKIGKDQLILMADNRITCRLGISSLSSSVNGASLHCIHLSRDSSQSKADQLNREYYTKSETRPDDDYGNRPSDHFTNGFLKHPPVTSLLSLDTVTALFNTQYKAYDNLHMETSCARIDHKYVESKLIKGHNESIHQFKKHTERQEGRESCTDEEKNKTSLGKTGRNDVGEEILPDRKRHKSENHQENQEINNREDRAGRKRHKTTSDACSAACMDTEVVSSDESVANKQSSVHKKHKTSHKHKFKRKDKQVKNRENEEMLSHRNMGYVDISDSATDETLKPNKDKTKNVRKVKCRDDSDETIEIKDKTLKKAEKGSFLSKLESSMKALRENKKVKTEGKKSKASEIHKKKSNNLACDKPSAGHVIHNVDQVFSSMFFGLSKEIGRIPKKTKAKRGCQTGSTSPQENVSDKRKKSSESKKEDVSEKDKSNESPKSSRKSNDMQVKKSKDKTGKDKSIKDKRSENIKARSISGRDDGIELQLLHERDDDVEMLDIVGGNFDRHKMVRETLSLEVDRTKRKEEKEKVVQSLDDIAYSDAVINKKKKKTKSVKRSVRVTDSDLKISLPVDKERKGKVELHLPKLVNYALFGDEIMSEMPADCLQLYDCCTSIHNVIPSSWTKSVKKKYVDGRKKYIYTVEILNTKDSMTEGKSIKNIIISDDNNASQSSCFNDFTNKMLNVVQKEKSKDLRLLKGEQRLCNRKSENVLVLPVATKIDLFSDDDEDLTEVKRNYDAEKDKEINRNTNIEKDTDINRHKEIDKGNGHEFHKLKDMNREYHIVKDKIKVLSEKIDHKNGKENSSEETTKDKDAKDCIQSVRKETNNEKEGNVNDHDNIKVNAVSNKILVEEDSTKTDMRDSDADSTGFVTTNMTARTSRSCTSSLDRIKRIPSGTETNSSKEESRVKTDSQDRKRGRSKERSTDIKSKERIRSISISRGSPSSSRDRQRSSRSRERGKRSSSRDRIVHSQSRERRSHSCDNKIDSPTESDIGKRLAKIASSVVSDSEKISSKSDKRRERQYHPYKKDSRPSKRHIPHWSFDLAYSDMNELLQNLTENTFKNINRKPANVDTYNKVGRRSYGNRGRFSSFHFRRSAVPRTPPREICYSSDDEDYMVCPDDIPDLKERAKQAEVLDNFMGTGEDEKEYSTEMLIYGKDMTEDRRIVCNSERNTDLVIPGGPKTATFSGEDLIVSDDELAFDGSARQVENQDTQNNQPSFVIERKNTYTNNLIKSKILEMKSASSEEGRKTEIPQEGDRGKTSDSKSSKVREETGVQNEKEVMAKEVSHKEGKGKVFISIELERHSLAPRNKSGREEAEEDTSDGHTKILLSDSDVCLDWTDEENALDNKEEDTVFNDSSDSISEAGVSMSYIVIDTIDGSDSETFEKINIDKSTSEILQTRSDKDVETHDLEKDLSDVRKTVKDLLENMKDIVCTNMKESKTHVCSVPENSMKTTRFDYNLCDSHRFPINMTYSEMLTPKHYASSCQIKQCSVMCSPLRINEYLCERRESKGKPSDEIEICKGVVSQKDTDFVPSSSVDKGDVALLTDTYNNAENLGAIAEILDKSTCSSVHYNQSNMNENVGAEKDDIIKLDSHILKDCLSEIETVSADNEKNCGLKIEDKTGINSEGEDNCSLLNIANHSACKPTVKFDASCDNSELSCELVEKTSIDNKSYRQTFQSSCRSNNFMFVDDVLVIGDTECELQDTLDSIEDFEYDKKDEITRHSEIFMNSSDLISFDSEDVPDLEDVNDEYVNTSVKEAEQDDEVNVCNIHECDEESFEPILDVISDSSDSSSYTEDKYKYDDTPVIKSERYLSTQQIKFSHLSKNHSSESQQEHVLYKIGIQGANIDNYGNDKHGRNEHTEEVKFKHRLDWQTDTLDGLNLSAFENFDNATVNKKAQLSNIEASKEKDVEVNVIDETKSDGTQCSSTDESEKDINYKPTPVGKFLSSCSFSGQKDVYHSEQICQEDDQVGGIDNDIESTSSTWQNPISEPGNGGSQSSSLYPSQLDDNAVFHIKDTFDEETFEQSDYAEDNHECMKMDNDASDECQYKKMEGNIPEGKENIGKSIEHKSNDTKIDENHSSDTEALWQKQNDLTYFQQANNTNMVRPTPVHTNPWIPLNRHPYNMWLPYPMWQPLQEAQSPEISPYRRPSFLPYLHPNQQSPLSPFLWNSIPMYTSCPSYVNSTGYSPSLMNYLLNSNTQAVSDQSNPSAASIAPWILSSDNMSHYIPDQNPDTYYITKYISFKDFNEKSSSKKERMCTEVSCKPANPLHEISLNEASLKGKINPRKLQNLCKEILDDTHKDNVNTKSEIKDDSYKSESYFKCTQNHKNSIADIQIADLSTKIKESLKYSAVHVSNKNSNQLYEKACSSQKIFAAEEETEIGETTEIIESTCSSTDSVLMNRGNGHFNDLESKETDEDSQKSKEFSILNEQESNYTNISKNKDVHLAQKNVNFQKDQVSIHLIDQARNCDSIQNELQTDGNYSNILSRATKDEICLRNESRFVTFHNFDLLKNKTNTAKDSTDTKSFKDKGILQKIDSNYKNDDEVSLRTDPDTDLLSQVLCSVGYLLNNLRKEEIGANCQRPKVLTVSKVNIVDELSEITIHSESGLKGKKCSYTKANVTEVLPSEFMSQNSSNSSTGKVSENNRLTSAVELKNHSKEKLEKCIIAKKGEKIDISEADKNGSLEEGIQNSVDIANNLNYTNKSAEETTKALEKCIIAKKVEKIDISEADKNGSLVEGIQNSVDIANNLNYINKSAEETTKARPHENKEGPYGCIFLNANDEKSDTASSYKVGIATAESKRSEGMIQTKQQIHFKSRNSLSGIGTFLNYLKKADTDVKKVDTSKKKNPLTNDLTELKGVKSCALEQRKLEVKTDGKTKDRNNLYIRENENCNDNLKSELASFYMSVGEDSVSLTSELGNSALSINASDLCSKSDKGKERNDLVCLKDETTCLYSKMVTQQENVKYQLPYTKSEFIKPTSAIHTNNSIMKDIDNDAGHSVPVLETMSDYKQVLVHKTSDSAIHHQRDLTETTEFPTKSYVDVANIKYIVENSSNLEDNISDKKCYDIDISPQHITCKQYIATEADQQLSRLEQVDNSSEHSVKSSYSDKCLVSKKMTEVKDNTDDFKVISKDIVPNNGLDPSYNVGLKETKQIFARTGCKSQMLCHVGFVQDTSEVCLKPEGKPTSCEKSKTELRNMFPVSGVSSDICLPNETSSMKLKKSQNLSKTEINCKWKKRNSLSGIGHILNKLKLSDTKEKKIFTSGKEIFAQENSSKDCSKFELRKDVNSFDGKCVARENVNHSKEVGSCLCQEESEMLSRSHDKANGRQFQKIVCLKPDAVKILLKVGMEMFLQILNENSTIQCKWCLNIFKEDIKKLQVEQQEAIREIEKSHSNLTIIGGTDNLEKYLMKESQTSNVSEIFVITDQPTGDDNRQSPVKYCCMETFLEEHLSSI